MAQQACLRCKHEWDSRVASPKECPACKSRTWFKEPGAPRCTPVVGTTLKRTAKCTAVVGTETADLPDELPELPDFEGILGSKNVAVEHQGSTLEPAEIPPSVEELAANPPFTALEGEK